ncbi:MAG TPA: methyltransferase domain-containing protein [Xanthobacteraceae bacterium]|nr:methyltransferase domain-containing protein [Xanthobacteraceae bacterium]
MEVKSKSLAQERFGAFAATYATSRPHAKGGSLARLVELVGPQPTWTALDIATGAGHMALAFAPGLAHVVASDLTPQMLDVARRLAHERNISNMSFVDLRAEALPFANTTFDLVTCRIAPHHFDDVRQFVAESARVLRPGGVFGLVENISPDASMMEGDVGAFAAAADEYNAFERLRDPSHVRCLTLSEWRDLVAGAGLKERHLELLDKPMVFGPWADQQNVADDIKYELRSMLLDGSAAFRAFVRPRENHGDLDFILTEAVIIAVK